MSLAVDQSRLTWRQREYYASPYQRHAWWPEGPGLLSPDRCCKCGTTSHSVAAGVSPRLCPVVIEGPPVLAWGCLTFPGGLTVRVEPSR